MRIDTADAIHAVAVDLGLDVTLVKDYSGRGMFGAKTTGLVGTIPDIMKAVASLAYDFGLADASAADFLNEVGGLSIDDFGKNQSIVY